MAAQNEDSKNNVVKPVRTSEYDENRGSYMDADGNYVYTTWEKRGKKWVEVPVCTIPLGENGENAEWIIMLDHADHEVDAEIKLDGARGGDVTKKKEELEETQKKSAELAETTINTLTTANEDLQKASKEDLEAQRAEKAAEKKKADKAAEKKKAEKEAAEERIEKAKVSTSESGEVSDETAAVSTEGTVLDGASVDIVSSGITVSTGSVAEPAGNNVDVKV